MKSKCVYIFCWILLQMLMLSENCSGHCYVLAEPTNGQIKFSQKAADNNYFPVPTIANYTCNSDYVLSGDKSRTCVGRFQWSGIRATCSIGVCSAPSSFANGNCWLLGTRRAGGIRICRCRSGYRLNNSSLERARCVVVNNKAVWDARQPSCNAYCTPLGEPTNGEVHYSQHASDHVLVRTVATFNCNSGYVLFGNKSQTCIGPHKWSGFRATCSIGICSASLFLVNGNCSVGNRRAGDTRTCQCNPGYRMNSSDLSTATCVVANNKAMWNVSQPTCTASCTTLEEPTNGLVYFSQNASDHVPVTTVATFNCNPGYVLSGNKSRTCIGPGKWSGIRTTCSTYCTRLEEPTNGRVYFSQNASEHVVETTVATFKCNSGYLLSGNKFRTCIGPDKWSGIRATCSIGVCPAPLSLVNGNCSVGNRRAGDIRTCRCHLGYIANSASLQTARCGIVNNKAVWNVSQPSCTVGICSAPLLVNGTCKAGNSRAGDTRTCRCNRGYRINSSGSTATCVVINNKAVWRLPICTAYCTTLREPTNGRIQFSQNASDHVLVTAVATYICNSGYVLFGSKSRTCFGPHKWSGFRGICSIGVCPAPLSVVNGSCSVGNRRAGDIRKCQCNLGYILNSTSLQTARCGIVNNKAVWNVSQPSCTVGKCPDRTLLPHGNCKITTVSTGSIRNCTCNWGYKMKGGDRGHSQCVVIDNKQTWSSHLPTCEARNCPLLHRPMHCSIDSNRTEFGSQPVNFVCDHGYKMTYGSKNRSCLATGQWSGIQPICQHVCAQQQNELVETARECMVDDTSQPGMRCMEKSQCSSEYSPVCAQNGEEYNNKCLMKIAGCEKGNNKIDIARQGNCRFGGVCGESRPAPPPGSSCKNVYYRYFHNTVSGECERYVHGDCYKGSNKFYTEEDCSRSCIETNPCMLEFEPGSCNYLNKLRWYFNRTSGMCQSFKYGGCFGNENHFLSKQDCLRKCRCSVCNSPVTPRLAKRQFEAVLVLQINSQRGVSNEVVSYNAKVISKCHFNGTKRLQDGDKGVLLATESLQREECRCPRLDKGKKYKVGVDVIGKLREKWKLKMRREFYVEMSESC